VKPISDIRGSIQSLAHLADEFGAAGVARDASDLLARVDECRFFLVCLGQFKRGKSTLINALLGENVLPSGVAPVTSVVTVVRHGTRGARVRVAGSWTDVATDQLAEYVAEDSNPENRKGVTGVEVFSRSPLLDGGLCLVDTPGIGSVFAGNTAETQSFVPHVDAALIVLGGDPPISGDELSLVKDVAVHVPALLFILNKADRLSAEEMHEARDFTSKVLREALGREPRLFEVSALESLNRTGSPREWPALIEALHALADEGGALVATAAARGLGSLAERLLAVVNEERSALLRPIDESERRLTSLRACAEEAEREAQELKFLFDAEQQRLGKRFDDDRQRFVDDALVLVERAVDTNLDRDGGTRGPGLRQRALDQVLEFVEPLVRAWMSREGPLAEHEFAAVTERFVGHANAFLQRLTTEGRLPADVFPAPLVPETGLRARSRFYFVSLMRLTSLSLSRRLADWLLSPTALRRSVRGETIGVARRLLEANCNRVVGDFDERMTESRRSVESALRRRLHETVTIATEALARTKAARDAGEEAVRSRVVELDDVLARLEAARKHLAPTTSDPSSFRRDEFLST
jgi:hypothetical protein